MLQSFYTLETFNFFMIYIIVVYKGYQGTLSPNNHTRKILPDFNLYQVFMYNFLDQNALILPNYVLFTRRMNTFWSRVLKNFGLGVLRYFGSNKKSHKKN